MSAMELKQVRDWHIGYSKAYEDYREPYRLHQIMADAIAAHLTAHAQMVKKVREVAYALSYHRGDKAFYKALADKLTTAIGDKP